jgi:signal transduction histidine kinase
MTLGRTSYLQALTNTVFLLAAAILALSLAWNPRAGYAGLNVFFARYLFSIGMPIEKWLYFLAELSRNESRPERFLAEAVAGLARLPWIAGASWRTAETGGDAGQRTPHPVGCEARELQLCIYSRYRTGPALHWHLSLVGQLLAEFYAAKLRERQLERASYMQAVHETGARLTHDVKNLLQSLNVLCSVAAENDSAQFQALVRRQLPLIAQRLATTLEKLRHPADGEAPQVPLREWWEGLVRQYQDRGVQFSAGEVPPQTRVPRALFDSVADNLLQNAIAKRAGSAALRISVTLSGEAAPELRVCDSGRAIPPEVARSLLRAPLRSAGGGLGIGLYEAARQAEAWGFALSLSANRDGEVCFTLSPAALPLLAAQGSTPAEISRP